ncbi:MAG: type IV pili methyl-accepting chemotaxis transducer N-terminal domain-containing protein [Candidatus Paceibacteria bacterium]
MKENTITNKIKLIGIFFIILMTSIIITTIYLNEKNKKDALLINIVGKQRMLTQKISKNIFYLYQNNESNKELDEAIIEFIYNLNSLKNGNTLIGIFKAPTNDIINQILKVEALWNEFYKNTNDFKKNLNKRNSSNELLLETIVRSVYNTNNVLLNEVDVLVSMYTVYTEEKTDYIRYIQYLFALIILILISYSFSQLKTMEANAKKFFEFSKQLTQNTDDKPLEPIQIEAEKEIVEATDTINCFINKINSAMVYSANAVEQSRNASIKLEEITDEFDIIINELTNSTEISKQLDRSEGIAIQTQEELINSTKKLQELKKELDILLSSCKIK